MRKIKKVKMSEIKLNTIPEAIEDLKNGKLIIVVDDENRENEGDFFCCRTYHSRNHQFHDHSWSWSYLYSTS